MMTIKHITLSGEESVFPAARMNYVPLGAAVVKGPDEPPATIWHYNAEGSATPITSGSVYVMNEHGRTVARYTLSDNGPQSEPVV
jgi:hypothetical protein